MIVVLLLAIGAVAAAMYFLLNKKEETGEREGIIRSILKKDAITVEFEEGKTSVVKFVGILPATEAEMLDDKIYEFMEANLRGSRVLIKPRHVDNGDVIVGEVRTMGGDYVNAALIRQGFARWSVSEAAGDSELAEAQEAAKTGHVGVWNPAIMQLVEEKRRQNEGQRSAEDIANLSIDPSLMETKNLGDN